MGNEMIIVGVFGFFLGMVLSYVILIRFKLAKKIKAFKLNRIVRDPHKLKELLEKNGELVDDGKKITFEVVKNKEGKEILEKKETTIPTAKETPKKLILPKATSSNKKAIKLSKKK